MDIGSFVFAVLIIAVPIAILVGALVLRAAVWLANQCLWAPAKRIRKYEPEDDEEEFARLAVSRTHRMAIRPLSFGRALGLSAACTFVQIVVALVQTFFNGVARIDAVQSVVLAGASLLLSSVAMAGLCAGMLPTTFGRGCLVTLFYVLISAAVVLVVGAPLLILLG